MWKAWNYSCLKNLNLTFWKRWKIKIKNPPEKIAKVAIRETFHQLSNRENLITVENDMQKYEWLSNSPNLSFYFSYILLSFQLHTGSLFGYVIVAAFAFLIKRYHTIYIYLFLTHLFAVSALLRAVFFLASIFSTFGFDHFPKKRQQILISESNKLNKSNV